MGTARGGVAGRLKAPVTSRDNPAFKAMGRLIASSAERRKRALSVLDGAHLIAACLDSGRPLEAVFVNVTSVLRPEVALLAARAAPAPVTVLSEALFHALSTVESATGILATAPTPAGRVVPADADLVLLLENLQDPGNLGTLLRSAAAAGAGHVALSKRCVFAWSPRVLRAAMGAHFMLNIAEGVDLEAYLRDYRGLSVALAADAPASLFEADLRGPVAILVGNEGAGLSRPLREAAGIRARIPMPGPMESLNAGVAGSLCLFEALRQRAGRRASPSHAAR